jgi:hypothetical protein
VPLVSPFWRMISLQDASRLRSRVGDSSCASQGVICDRIKLAPECRATLAYRRLTWLTQPKSRRNRVAAATVWRIIGSCVEDSLSVQRSCIHALIPAANAKTTSPRNRNEASWSCSQRKETVPLRSRSVYSTFSSASDSLVSTSALLLRQYFPRGTDLSAFSQAQLDQVAVRLNQRPRKTLGFQTPASRLQQSVASTV